MLIQSRLTKSIISSHSFAYTTALLYTLAPTPAILVSPYTEPLYALCAFTGFYYVSQRRWILAAGVLAMATGLRATGLFNVGVLGWAMVFVDTPTEKIRFTVSCNLRDKCSSSCLVEASQKSTVGDSTVCPGHYPISRLSVLRIYLLLLGNFDASAMVRYDVAYAV